MNKYIINPKEVYTLELNKLQRCFSDISRIGEAVSEAKNVEWRQVEYLRQLNFMLEGAAQVGNMMLEHTS